jgi:hypothetical protein
MYRLYKNNFILTGKGQLDTLINHCIKVSAIHIKYLHFSGKLFFTYDISYFDLAVDLLAEIFETKDNVLFNFKKFFESFGTIHNDNEFEKRLRLFIISIVNRNLVKFYKDNDPLSYRLIRNIDYAIEAKGYFITHLLTDKYIHRNSVDFNMPDIEKEKLINVLNVDSKSLLTGTAFIEKLFDTLESFGDYIQSLPYYEIISIYKELLVMNFFKNSSNSINSFEYDKLNTVFLIKEAYENFRIKFDNYAGKINLSEKTAVRFINIMDEIKESYCNLSGKDSINNYIKKNFEKHEMDSLENKLEYCVGLFNNEILYLLKNEGVYEGN